MVVEGYYDNGTVRPVKPLKLKENQKVYIELPADYEEELSEEELAERQRRQKEAIRGLFNLLDDDEVEEFDKAMQQGLKFKEVNFR